MTHYKDQLIACDFFTVETLFLKTLYVLVFVEIDSRRVHFAGCTAHPNNAWITQQARQVMWNLEDREPGIRFLIRDNDKKFTESFDTVFRSEGDLDKLIIVNQTHLRRVNTFCFSILLVPIKASINNRLFPAPIGERIRSLSQCAWWDHP
jgi:hypothetical protein